MRFRCAEEISMPFSFSRLLSVVLLAGLTVLFTLPAHAYQSPPPSSVQKLTVKEASIILKNANRAMEDVMLAGIVPTVDLNSEQCENLMTKQKHIVSLSTYQHAQRIMMNAGRLTTESAGAQLKSQTRFLRHAKNHIPSLTKTCQTISNASEISR